MRLRRPYVFATLAAASVAAVVACTLNPQPLPPRDEASSLGDASADGGAFGTGPQNPRAPQDAAGALDSDAQSPKDSGDGGDGGSDGGDAGPDADGG